VRPAWGKEGKLDFAENPPGGVRNSIRKRKTERHILPWGEGGGKNKGKKVKRKSSH